VAARLVAQARQVREEAGPRPREDWEAQAEQHPELPGRPYREATAGKQLEEEEEEGILEEVVVTTAVVAAGQATSTLPSEVQ